MLEKVPACGHASRPALLAFWVSAALAIFLVVQHERHGAEFANVEEGV
jgi:hypothetical protein